MFTDQLTVVAASAVPAMMAPMAPNPAPAATITITVKSASTGATFSFIDVETNAALYYIGATLTHTIAPTPPAASS